MTALVAPHLRAAALIMLIPFLLLSLMAQGTMVAPGASPQSFMMVLCGDHAPVEMVLDDQGNVVPKDAQGDRPSKAAAPCAWAAHAQGALIAPAVRVAGPTGAFVPAEARALAAMPRHPARPRTTSARDPPVA